MDYGNLFVCLMGMGTVFFGLVCLIALTRLMSIALHCVRQKPEAAVPAGVPVQRELGDEFVRRFYALVPRSGLTHDQRELAETIIAALRG